MSEVDRVTVIRRMECSTCDLVNVPPGMSHIKLNGFGARCHGPVVAVEYVPRSQLRGAVANANAGDALKVAVIDTLRTTHSPDVLRERLWNAVKDYQDATDGGGQ